MIVKEELIKRKNIEVLQVPSNKEYGWIVKIQASSEIEAAQFKERILLDQVKVREFEKEIFWLQGPIRLNDFSAIIKRLIDVMGKIPAQLCYRCHVNYTPQFDGCSLCEKCYGTVN